ncbi:MAG: PilZ domain-containing protein [Sphingorhabdus sp.]|uniref:PilZ domain-containing protein n=1 Tax=Sphingorhabdus sp. TaxID=1902408 RepID=UPI0032BC3F20
MMNPRSFGKLGNRKMARLATEIDAGMVLPERSERCRLENISRTGCRLQLGGPPRVGATVLIRVERIEAMGIVAWVRGNRCGVKFPEPLAIRELERIRWIVEHANAHEQNSLAHATAVWR